MKTNFVKIMGNTAINRILDFLILNDRESWNLVELRDEANVAYPTLKEIIPKMLKDELIVVHKTIGKSKLYKINKSNPVIVKIYELYNVINHTTNKKIMKDL